MILKANTYKPRIGEKLYLKGQQFDYFLQGKRVPIQILKEYPCFYMVRVLPHPATFGTSTPYEISLNKGDIIGGDILLYG